MVIAAALFVNRISMTSQATLKSSWLEATPTR